MTSHRDLQNKSMHTYLHLLPATRHLLPTTASPKPEGHNKITMSTSRQSPVLLPSEDFYVPKFFNIILY
jgi:hypothetical protein